MSYYLEPDSYISNKVKKILDLKNYATKNKLEDAAAADTSNLAAEGDFIALKAEAFKLDIDKLINAPIGLNNSKTKVDDLDVNKLKTFLVLFFNKILSDVVSNKVVKNTKCNKLNLKVNN